MRTDCMDSTNLVSESVAVCFQHDWRVMSIDKLWNLFCSHFFKRKYETTKIVYKQTFYYTLDEWVFKYT